MRKRHSPINGMIPSAVEFVSLTSELTRFRQRLETEADKPVHELDVNAALLLSDLAQFLKLGPKQHDQILGQPAGPIASNCSIHGSALPRNNSGKPLARPLTRATEAGRSMQSHRPKDRFILNVFIEATLTNKTIVQFLRVFGR